MAFLVAIVGIASMMLLSVTAHFHALSATYSADVAVARAEFDRLRLFIFVADQYMSGAAGATSGQLQVSWQTMARSSIAPPGARAVQMPATWYVVRNADRSWVACTEVSERTAGMIVQLVPATSAAAAVVTTVGDHSRTFLPLGTSVADAARTVQPCLAPASAS